jgi:hypothetical protein
MSFSNSSLNRKKIHLTVVSSRKRNNLKRNNMYAVSSRKRNNLYSGKVQTWIFDYQVTATKKHKKLLILSIKILHARTPG